MYPLQLTHNRQREVFQSAKSLLAGSGVSGYKIQPTNIRVFARPSTSDRTLTFVPSAGDGNSVISELEYLLQSGRVSLVYAMAVGIAAVPIVDGDEMFANVKYTSNPYNTNVVPASCTKSALAIFNGFTKFETNEVSRLSKFATTNFLGETPHSVPNTLKPVLFPAAYTLIGGEDNKLSISIPATGNVSDILGDATTRLYAVIEFHGFEIVTGSDKKTIIAQALNS